MKKPTPILECFNTTFSDIYKQVSQLETINQAVKNFLPSTLHAHCKVAGFYQGTLLLGVDDASWATPLRYSAPELRNYLRQKAGLYQLSSIKIVVCLEQQTRPINKKPSPTLSNQAKASIIEGIETCNYEPLKIAMQRLAGKDRKEP